MQIINQTQNETNKTIDIQLISTPLIQLGEQLTLALVKKTKKFSMINSILLFIFRNS